MRWPVYNGVIWFNTGQRKEIEIADKAEPGAHGLAGAPGSTRTCGSTFSASGSAMNTWYN